MAAMSATALRNDIYNVIEEVNETSEPVFITNRRGSSAVLLSESDWRSIEETLYINSIPNLANTIESENNDNIDDCCSADELKW